ncbi:Hypothetical_protein [Hexamita inflata]|uniref:Hypothetical_protein n=1 Tax=Hexamita inflata TaxID=28002 RepID=A0AA86RQ36_9EUKA|nr:Hypothetical protein HINF_LOCUS58195 [Hexamita inflata]
MKAVSHSRNFLVLVTFLDRQFLLCCVPIFFVQELMKYIIRHNYRIVSTILINRYRTLEKPLAKGQTRVIHYIINDNGTKYELDVLEIHPENKSQYNIAYNFNPSYPNIDQKNQYTYKEQINLFNTIHQKEVVIHAMITKIN